MKWKLNFSLVVHGVQETEGSTNFRYKIQKGFALIIHNKYFPNRDVPEREGSEQDVLVIKKFCEEAGFAVNQTSMKTTNLKACQMYDLCTEIAERSFSRYDAFACFILSHGCEDGIYGTDDNIITLQEIVTKFKKCEGLAGKPKLFFIQACQGTNQDSGISIEADSHPVSPPINRLRMPTDSDILVANSTVPGYEAYRHVEGGSWFIRTLMEKLEEHAHEMHLMDILTLVNHKIAGYSTPTNLKQMSCQMTTLTKFVYFNYPAPLS